jgi:hypothetical protein
LKFDCPPGGDLTRTGVVRANPCAFKGATRDHLPEKVVRQARIDADKAEFYDRVLKARDDMRNDPSKGNLPMASCRSSRPRNSFKFGRLPCYLIPPEGSLDPEVFVEPIPPKHPRKPGEMTE